MRSMVEGADAAPDARLQPCFGFVRCSASGRPLHRPARFARGINTRRARRAGAVPLPRKRGRIHLPWSARRRAEGRPRAFRVARTHAGWPDASWRGIGFCARFGGALAIATRRHRFRAAGLRRPRRCSALRFGSIAVRGRSNALSSGARGNAKGCALGDGRGAEDARNYSRHRRTGRAW